MTSLELFCDLFASILLILSFRLFKKIAKEEAINVGYAKDKIDIKIELDMNVAISHIIIVLGYTTLSILPIFSKNVL